MSAPTRTRMVLAAAVVVVAVAVWGVSETQRGTAERVFDVSQAADTMLIAMLDQQIGLHGFKLTRERVFLQPFVNGIRSFNLATEKAREVADEDTRPMVDRVERAALRWRADAEDEIARVALDENADFDRAGALERNALFQGFRTRIEGFKEELADQRDRKLARAGVISVAVIALLSLLFGGLGLLMLERQVRRSRARRAVESDYRRAQADFVETIQIMRNEPEAHDMLKQHLERSISDSDVLVLSRNNSDNRLAPATALEEGSAIAAALVDAEAESCLAVRLGRQYEWLADAPPLLTCDLCGASATEIVCTPSLVGGEVIGSVLVRADRPFDRTERERISDSVTQASPVLANLRNLAIAQSRAATDALTGLPNARSCRDTIKRMVAHANRAVTPLSAVLFDLDHFKTINDGYGHSVGDDVLAGVGETLREALRASDFGGRYGGEEFLMLLPGTDAAGALNAAEKLRAAIEALEFQHPELTVGASFGIATYPLDALDADGLLRMADRALYSAKAKGRNRVELVDGPPDV